MSTLLAEDLLLLLLDDEKGTTGALWVDVRVPLAGAVLAELAIEGAVRVDAATSIWRAAIVRPVEGAAPTDPVLAKALATVAEKPRSAQSLLPRLGAGLRDELAARLTAAGILERHDDRVLGLFPRTRWPALQSTDEAHARERIGRALQEGAAPDERTAALIALLAAIGKVPQVLGLRGGEARAATKRARTIAEGDWAARAVRDAVRAAAAAVTTTAAVASTTTTIT
jgi:hypothetical protein